jgi:hypothetical protein
MRRLETQLSDDIPAVRGLRATAAIDTSTLAVTADYVRLRDPVAGTTVLRTSLSATLDLTTSGPAVNGRDQSANFSATWVHIYAIWSGTTLGTIGSATAPPTGPTTNTWTKVSEQMRTDWSTRHGRSPCRCGLGRCRSTMGCCSTEASRTARAAAAAASRHASPRPTSDRLRRTRSGATTARSSSGASTATATFRRSRCPGESERMAATVARELEAP